MYWTQHRCDADDKYNFVPKCEAAGECKGASRNKPEKVLRFQQN